jgi:hypothetical protein
MNSKTITIGCPISNRAYLIERFLNGIYKLNYDKKLIKLYFVVNNSKDSTYSDLKEFERKHKDEYLNIKIEKYKIKSAKEARVTKIRLKTYSRLAELRNYILSNIDTDYFFSLDSDIMVDINLDCLNKLLEAQKDIIAAVINNDSMLRPNAKYPKIRTNLLKNVDKGITHILDWKLNEIFEVDHTGAVYLLTKDVCKNVQYGFHKQGEDMAFCNMAKEKGYKIFAHGGIFLQHIMREYQSFCIENKCQNPCVVLNKKMKIGKNEDGKLGEVKNDIDLTYQYKFVDNVKYPDLVGCGKLKKGEKALFNNDFYNPLDDIKGENLNEKK